MDTLRAADDHGARMRWLKKQLDGDHRPSCPAADDTNMGPPCSCGYDTTYVVARDLMQIVSDDFRRRMGAAESPPSLLRQSVDSRVAQAIVDLAEIRRRLPPPPFEMAAYTQTMWDEVRASIMSINDALQTPGQKA